MTGTRYTRKDVAEILVNVNSAGERLRMRGAGQWAVETMGGTYLYLTDRSEKTPSGGEAHGYPPGGSGPGVRIHDLGRGWHAAANELLSFLSVLHTVEMMQTRTDPVPDWKV